ncbi:L,D-transpeptidase [uncultured Enterovirga sp.]|uniref:L,D-transpeptidase n=1 Tax=uncultured Enterovirga sp. TaxID=2026352 RepID=UPI0035CAE290
MTRLTWTMALGCVLAAATTPAFAQGLPRQSVRGGQYGGGFLELLMTGQEAVRAAPRSALLGHAPDPLLAGLPASYPAEAVVRRETDPIYRRRTVAYDGPDAPGTIVVDTPSRFLYHVQPGGQAIRYGIGVGRPGFTWAGMKTVTAKREWPGWTPPPQMLARRPDLPRHMEGGPGNPLGARALYLGSSLYRIHGTNEPHTIGQDVSSGCIRMMNEDVTDLYARVRVGTRVRVI